MSIDVFGRRLNNKTAATRGPPGIGYKLTNDGQFDLENKRICNVAPANELNDAVNLDTLQRIVRGEIHGVTDITSRIRIELDNLQTVIDVHRHEIDTKIAQIMVEISDLKETVEENSHFIKPILARPHSSQTETAY